MTLSFVWPSCRCPTQEELVRAIPPPLPVRGGDHTACHSPASAHRLPLALPSNSARERSPLRLPTPVGQGYCLKLAEIRRSRPVCIGRAEGGGQLARAPREDRIVRRRAHEAQPAIQFEGRAQV